MTTKTIWIVTIEDRQPEHLRFDTEAEAETAADRIRTDGRRWAADSIQVLRQVEKISRVVKSTSWHSSRPDANSTAWARRGFGDGDI